MTSAQLKLRALRERQSKERGRVAELAVADELTDETRAELDTIETGTPDLERQIRAATVAVEIEESEQRAAGAAGAAGDTPAGDAEDRERAELRAKVKLGGYVAAAIEQRSAAGAEAEYNAALGIAGNRFPLELLAPPEQRAARVVNRAARAEDRETTGVDTMTAPRTWLDRLFAGTAAEAVGVSMESVPVGKSSHPVTSTGATAAQRGKSEAADDAAWTLSVIEMTPKRNAVRLLFNIEDAARIPGLESALTRDLRMTMVEGIDRAIFLGDNGASPNAADIVGLTTAAGLVEKSISQTGKVKGSDTLQVFAELIDGKGAMTPGDLNTVLAVGANTLWSHTLANTGASVDTTIAEFLRRFGLNWLTRGEIEDTTADTEFAAFVGLGRGLDGSGVAAVWEAGELIRDPYSGAAKGEVALTLCYLWDFKLPRASNFARVTFGS